MESGPRNGAQLYLGRMRRRLIVLTLGLALVAAQADPAAAVTNVRALNNYFQVSRITIQVDRAFGGRRPATTRSPLTEGSGRRTP